MKNLPAMRVIALFICCATLLNCGSGRSAQQTGSEQPALQTITISPANQTIADGTGLQLSAMGTYSNSSTQTLTSLVTWQTNKSAIATVNGQGYVNGLTQGAAQISASYEGVTGSTLLTVGTAVLVSISVSPGSSSLPIGESEQLAATGKFSDGSTQDLTQSASWSSLSTGIASVSSSGSVLANTTGNTTITAASGSVSGQASIAVGQAVLTSITVSPNSSSVPLGDSEQLTATGNYSNGSTQNLTQSATWSSAGNGIASVNASGTVTTSSTGTTMVTATVGSVAGSASVTVGQAALLSISVAPAQSSMALGQSGQFTATGSYSNGSTQNLTQSATWTSTGGASVASNGVVQALSLGPATITASAGSVAGSASLTVTPLQGDNSVYFVTHFSNNVTAAPDGTVRVINDGTQATATLNGTLYADIYVFDDSEEMISCCSCQITADGLLAESVSQQLANPGGPTGPGVYGSTFSTRGEFSRGVIKIVSSSSSDPTNPVPVPGLRAWATKIQATSVALGVPPTEVGPYYTTEAPFADSNLSPAELSNLGSVCSYGLQDNSGYGWCGCSPEDEDF